MTRRPNHVRRIVLPLVVWAGIVWARAHLVENIRPWELLWCLWVVSTSVASGCVGAMIMDAWRSRDDDTRL